MPWFEWNGVSSEDYGLWISKLPQRVRPEERTEEIIIPGRAGSLLYKEGENVHNAYVKECVVTARADADYPAILQWLSGDGKVIFSDESDRVYTAHIVGQVAFDRLSNSLKQATIPFLVHPHKAQYPPEAQIQMSASGTLYNPGTVTARPLVDVTFTGACTVSIGGVEMTFTGNPDEWEDPAVPEQETITVDCDAQVVTNTDGIWRGTSTGDFWIIPPGHCTVSITDAAITITPRWRWY